MIAKKCIAASSKKKASATSPIFDLDCHLSRTGTHYKIYQKLGTHSKTYKRKEGTYLIAWVPHAEEVRLVGDFDNWSPEANPTERTSKSDTQEISNPSMKLGKLYKFAITTQSDGILYKTDPFVFGAEYRPGTASVTADIQGFFWTDSAWIEKRTQADAQKLPMDTYEAHLGSQCKRDRLEKDSSYTYTEAVHELATYVEEMGYIHIELIGIAERPLDGSWRYQVTGYFVPASRYDTPAGFVYFVSYLHENGIGVVLDWVPAHFPKDVHDLADFDGEPLFRYADSRKGKYPDWGTKVFDHGKNEVRNFFIGNAFYWMGQYHVDGLRVDTVASILYLDYERQESQWIPNIHGGNQNLEVVEFLKYPNTVVQGYNHGALIIAEESTVWPKVTGHPEQDGSGFTFKWNMEWTHDFLEYMKLDPYFRKYNHHRIAFGLTYFTSEDYVLVPSHDEVVHLKCSMINETPGSGKDKFSNLRAGYAFMMGHPGKKLLFMGQSFGQLHEWDEKVSLGWYLTDEDDHRELQNYMKDLLHLYKRYPSPYRQDDDWNSFQWINANNGDRSIFSSIRRDETGKENLMFIISFTPVERPDYRVGFPKRGRYTLLLDNHGAYRTVEAPCSSSSKNECDEQPYSFSYPLSAYGTTIFHS